MKVVLLEISKGRQSVIVQKIIQGTNNMIRLELQSDSYSFQCHSVIEVFSEVNKQWNRLYKHFNHSIKDSLAYSVKNHQKVEIVLPEFQQEIKYLEKIAGEILKDKFQ